MFSLCVRKLLLCWKLLELGLVPASALGCGAVLAVGCSEAGVVIQQTSNIDRCYINEDQFDRVSVIHHPAALLPASPAHCQHQPGHTLHRDMQPGENNINTIGCLK